MIAASTKISVLDRGSLEVVGVLGDDLMVVNNARVSFAGTSNLLTERDRKLIHYLARHKHWSPFYHPQISVRVRAPISVQRQWFKHKVGTAENSESTRYVEILEEFYVPQSFRRQSKSNKQGSEGEIEGQDAARQRFLDACSASFGAYRDLLGLGVAKEQARELLPLCTYTSWVWTASLMACLHFIELRDAPDAQFEIRSYARALRHIVEASFPVSVTAFEEARRAP